MKVKECKWCKRLFISISHAQLYCCDKCRRKHNTYKRKLNDGQLCWNCKNACGNCSWSRNFKPIEGWIATPSIIKDYEYGDIESYDIKMCPEFISNLKG